MPDLLTQLAQRQKERERESKSMPKETIGTEWGAGEQSDLLLDALKERQLLHALKQRQEESSLSNIEPYQSTIQSYKPATKSQIEDVAKSLAEMRGIKKNEVRGEDIVKALEGTGYTIDPNYITKKDDVGLIASFRSWGGPERYKQVADIVSTERKPVAPPEVGEKLVERSEEDDIKTREYLRSKYGPEGYLETIKQERAQKQAEKAIIKWADRYIKGFTDEELKNAGLPTAGERKDPEAEQKYKQEKQRRQDELARVFSAVTDPMFPTLSDKEKDKLLLTISTNWKNRSPEEKQKIFEYGEKVAKQRVAESIAKGEKEPYFPGQDIPPIAWDEERGALKEIPSGFAATLVNLIGGVIYSGEHWLQSQIKNAWVLNQLMPGLKETEYIGIDWLSPEARQRFINRNDWLRPKGAMRDPNRPLGERIADPDWWARGIGGMLPTTGAVIGATATGHPYLGMAFIAAAEGGGAYERAIETGLSPNQAALQGLAVGTVNAALEQVPAERLVSKFGAKTAQAARRQARQSLTRRVTGLLQRSGRFVEEAGRQAMVEGVTESTQEAWQAFVADMGGEDTDWAQAGDEIISAGLLGGATGFLFGGGGQMVRGAQEIATQRAQRRQQLSAQKDRLMALEAEGRFSPRQAAKLYAEIQDSPQDAANIIDRALQDERIAHPRPEDIEHLEVGQLRLEESSEREREAIRKRKAAVERLGVSETIDSADDMRVLNEILGKDPEEEARRAIVIEEEGPAEGQMQDPAPEEIQAVQEITQEKPGPPTREAQEQHIKERRVEKPTKKQQAQVTPDKQIEGLPVAVEVDLGGTKGGTGEIHTDNYIKVPYRWELVDISDLITSHDLKGEANPRFPQVLQQRWRNARASLEQIEMTANRLNPARLAGPSPEPNNGAPTVGPDGVVEARNAGVLALKLAYQQIPNRAQQYKQWLREHVEDFGIDPEAVDEYDQPILVRKRTEVMMPRDRVQFTREANAPLASTMGLTEQGKTDSERINTSMLSSFETDSRGNPKFNMSNDFVRDFVHSLPQSERPGVLTKDGTSLNVTGEARLKSAIINRIYSDPSADQVEVNALVSLIERGGEEENIKNISNALVGAAQEFAQVRQQVESGAIPPEKNPIPAVIDAVALIRRARANQTSKIGKDQTLIAALDDILHQTTLFEGDIPQVKVGAAIIAQQFAKNINKPKVLREKLQNMAVTFIEDAPFQKSLIGMEGEEIPLGQQVKMAMEEQYKGDGENQYLYCGLPLWPFNHNKDQSVTDWLRKSEGRAGEANRKALAMQEHENKNLRESIVNYLTKHWIDVSGNIKRKLQEIDPESGKAASMMLDLWRGAGSYARYRYQAAVDRVYNGLQSKDEEAAVANVAMFRRIIEATKIQHEKGIELESPISPEEAQAALDEMENKLSDEALGRINKAVDTLNFELRHNLTRLNEEGILGDRIYEELLEKHQNYYPREFLHHLSSYDPSKALQKGSEELMLNNPRYLLAQSITITEERIGKTKQNRALAEFARANPDNGIVRMAEKKKVAPEQKTLRGMAPEREWEEPPSGWIEIIFRDEHSREQRMFMEKRWAEQWVKYDPELRGGIRKFLHWASGTPVLKAFATGYNPAFAITNVPRDIALIFLQANSPYSSWLPATGLQMAADIVSVWHDTIHREGRFADYLKEGGGMEFLANQAPGREHAITKTMRQNVHPHLEKVGAIAGYIGETSEILTRLMVRERAIKAGYSSVEATHMARNYLDFNQGGSTAKALNQFLPYFNATMQGARSGFRALKDDPVLMGLKAAQFVGMGIGLTAANMLINDEAWKMVPEDVKARYFVFVLPEFISKYEDKNGRKRYRVLRIPKPEFLRPIMRPIEGLTEYFIDGSMPPNSIWTGVQEAIHMVPVDSWPPTLKAFIGYAGNLDTWRMEPVYTKYDDAAPHTERTVYTHPVWKEIADFMKPYVSLSPERMQYAAGSIFSPYNPFVGLLNVGSRSILQDIPEEDRKLFWWKMTEDITGLGRIIQHTGTSDTYNAERDKRLNRKIITARHENLNTIKEMVADNQSEKTILKKIRSGEGFNFKDIKNVREEKKRLYKNARLLLSKEGIETWMLEARQYTPEARAQAFFYRWKNASEKERKNLVRKTKIIDAKLGGFRTERYKQHLASLIRDYRAGKE